MPFTPKQNRLFRAAEHNPALAKRLGISGSVAGKLAHEGIKRSINEPKAQPRGTRRK
jgi:hypothetical protein